MTKKSENAGTFPDWNKRYHTKASTTYQHLKL